MTCSRWYCSWGTIRADFKETGRSRGGGAHQRDDDALRVGREAAGVGVEEDNVADGEPEVVGEPPLRRVHPRRLVAERDLDVLEGLALLAEDREGQLVAGLHADEVALED